MHDGDAVARLQLVACPFDILVDLVVAAPGVEIDRLAARGLYSGIEICHLCLCRERQENKEHKQLGSC